MLTASPGIPLSSTVSISSAASMIATSNCGVPRLIPPPPPPSPPPPVNFGSHWYPPYPIEGDNQRGMVPASPYNPKTPPTQGLRLKAPPKTFRVTAKPSGDDCLCWSPFRANRNCSDFFLQQKMQKRRQEYQQRKKRQIFRHQELWRYPLHVPSNHALPAQPGPYTVPGYHCAPEVIGHPSLRIYKLRLPFSLVLLLDQIIDGCESHASCSPSGWRTDLYSLTRQDIALMDAPGMMEIAMPILNYLTRCICEVYRANSVKVDRNQPHVLKYSHRHRGVELHHDRCDVTANLMMSREHTYTGGGTFFPDLNTVVRLKYGEFILHPGSLVHGGSEITQGIRYLMVLFAHLK